MSKRTIYITDFDLKRLKSLFDSASERFPMDVQHLKELHEELDRAIVVQPKDIPADVITMNTKVRVVDLKTDEITTLSLVFPDDANVDANRISVLAPIGTAMLGYRVGGSISWKVPAGFTRLKVDEVLYQPEAAGNFRE